MLRERGCSLVQDVQHTPATSRIGFPMLTLLRSPSELFTEIGNLQYIVPTEMDIDD